jgi:hypothetical protein
VGYVGVKYTWTHGDGEVKGLYIEVGCDGGDRYRDLLHFYA